MRRRVDDQLAEASGGSSASSPSASQPRGGRRAGRGLALADLVAVEHQHARAASRRSSRATASPAKRAPQTSTSQSPLRAGALGAPLGGSDRHRAQAILGPRHAARYPRPLTMTAMHHRPTTATPRSSRARDGLLLEIDGQIVPNYDATFAPFEEGDVVTGHVVRIDKDEVLVDIGYKSEGSSPPTSSRSASRRPARRGRARRGGRRAGPHQGGPGRPPDHVQEARPLREGLAPHRGRRRVRRAGRGHRHRGRQGRPDHRPRRARLPARLAGRHPPRAEPRRVPGHEDRVQGHRAQPLAQQRRALAAARCSRRSARSSARRSSTACSRAWSSRARSRTSSTSARSSTSTASTA